MKTLIYLTVASCLVILDAHASNDCCGTTTYDPATQACCNDQTVYSTELDGPHSDEGVINLAPAGLAWIASIVGANMEGEVSYSGEHYKGKDCCDNAVVDYVTGYVTVSGSATGTNTIENFPPFAALVAAVNALSGVISLEFDVEGSVGLHLSGTGTITQTWENCADSFTGKTVMIGCVTGAGGGSLKWKNNLGDPEIGSVTFVAEGCLRGEKEGSGIGPGDLIPSDWSGHPCLIVRAHLPFLEEPIEKRDGICRSGAGS